MNFIPQISVDKNHVVTFTGHRPAKLGPKSSVYKAKHYERFIPMLANALEDYLENGYYAFITGGAQGFDMSVFWAVEELKKRHPDTKILNIVYVPFKGQESRWGRYDIFGQDMYRKMLDAADDVQYCTDLTTGASSYEIGRALNYRNECMCNSASRLCSLWSEEENTNGQLTPGGTANCTKYATKNGLKVDRVVHALDDNGQLVVV